MIYFQDDELKDLLSWIKINDRVTYYCFLYICNNPLTNEFDITIPLEIKSELDHLSLVMPPPENKRIVALDVITNSFSVPNENNDVTRNEINANDIYLGDSLKDSFGELIEAIDGPEKISCSDYINGLSILSNIKLGASSKNVYQIINDYYYNVNANHPEKVKHISKMEKAWRSCFNSYPNSFRWLDPKNDTQTLWVWEYFKIKMMRIPFEPIDSFQRYNLIISSFDLWDGWSDEQCASLNKKRKHPLKKSNANFLDSSSGEHKDIFLSEIDKARRQQKFRDQKKVKNESKNVVNISVSYIDKLTMLGENLKMDNDKVIKMLIDEKVKEILMNN